jgi:hypothetical protein
VSRILFLGKPFFVSTSNSKRIETDTPSVLKEWSFFVFLLLSLNVEELALH